ncbi:poly(rC)-binding protein 1-like [Sorex araneus]|uniref:poly(rC)-binding protein 1-like n=1 Tax=Sorex araneus TaxID=42254 RepID=UPI002433C027|nr:poly(rC)-binding protein 1-like [Sorex araneus]
MYRGLRGMAARVQISLTLRLTVHGPGSLRNMGQEREFARRLQVESGAQVSMSGDNWPERSLTLRGSSDVIFRALIMIIDTIHEDICSTLPLADGPQPFVTLRLRVPTSQCITLLEEDGSRVRDICARTGTQVHVSGNLPPGDSELSMTGWPHCVSECMKLICQNLLETLVGILQDRGPVLAYQPALGPALAADGHSEAAEGSTYTRGRLYSRGYPCSRGDPHTGGDPYARGNPYTGGNSYSRGDTYSRGNPYTSDVPYARGIPYVGGNPYTRGIHYAGGIPYTRGNPYPYAGSHPQAAGYPHFLPYLHGQPQPQPGSSRGLSAMFPFYWRAVQQPAGSYSMGVSEPPEIIHEIIIPNDFIGCVIGLQGANVSEIRRKSGARVKIFPLMEGSSLRLVRITGTPASIIVAHIMVISSLSHQRL